MLYDLGIRRYKYEIRNIKIKNTINYYIIKDYTKNDKRSTKPILRISNPEEVKKLAGDIDYKVWLNNYVKNIMMNILKKKP